MEKLGIANLKVAITAGINLGIKIEKNLDDGKISLGEALAIGGSSFSDVVRILRNGAKIKDEFLDLSDTEIQELRLYVREKLDLENDKIEGIIEKAIEFLIALDSLVKAF